MKNDLALDSQQIWIFKPDNLQLRSWENMGNGPKNVLYLEKLLLSGDPLPPHPHRKQLAARHLGTSGATIPANEVSAVAN